MSRIDRFKKRQNIKKSINTYARSDEALVNEFLTSSVNTTKINKVKKSVKDYYDISVSQKEAQAFLVQFKKEFDTNKFNKLVDDCKKDIINSIVTPFGLGKIVAVYDKIGGNVTTIHNAKQKIYTNESDKYNRDSYVKSSKNIGGKKDSFNTVRDNAKINAMNKNGQIQDVNTGRWHNSSEMDLDHNKPLENFHEEGGFMIDDIKKREFGADSGNHNFTHNSTNRSKGSQNHKEFSNNKNNKEKYKLDNRRTNAAYERGEKTAKKYLPTNTEKIKHYSKKTIETGIDEGLKMGTQQALGLIITEFFTAVFDEIIDIYKNGFSNGFDNDKFFTILKKRLKKISIRVSQKWKDVAVAFKDGFISGFISNLVTTVINMFITTGKRVVRIIREGIYSLFRAVKLLLFPPKNMTSEEAMHEAKKLIATGLIVSLGVIAEEYIDILIKSTAILEPFADILTSVFVGAITGLTITMVVYYIDKKKDEKDFNKHLLSTANKHFEAFNI